MVEIQVDYEGALHTQCTHTPTGRTLHTDAPKDNHGKGEDFSPTDLLGASLGSCILTVMGIYAQRSGIELKGMRAKVVKEMTLPPQPRACRFKVEVHCPVFVEEKMRTQLERVATHCPVHQSLQPETLQELKFYWAEQNG